MLTSTYSIGTYSRSWPHRQSIRYRNFNHYGIKCPIRLRMNFNWVGTNCVIKHVEDLSAKVGRHEPLKWVIMANSSRHWSHVRANFRLQKITRNSIQKIKLPKKLQSSLFLFYYTERKIAIALMKNLLSDWLCTPLLYMYDVIGR